MAGILMLTRNCLFLSFLLCTVIMLFSSTITNAAADTINVEDFGAKPDGRTDAKQAFLKAWTTACSFTKPTIIHVPRRTYLLSQIVFQGPCQNTKGITLRIDGVLAAPDYEKMGSEENWIMFYDVQRVSVTGGYLNGEGRSLWRCKLDNKPGCPEGASSLAFYNSKYIKVKNVYSINAKLYHIVVHSCTNVTIQGVKIDAPEDSPNTDGVHIQHSSNVRVLNTGIRTGDDCISIGPGTKNLRIEYVACGPGHGISIGSLAKGLEEDGVQDVVVKNVVFTGTQNGLRIKAWARPSNGFVRDVLFKQAVMNNVQNPIVIDQNYCPGIENCPDQHSGIDISQVTYVNIKGTSATQVAVKFDCSKTSPCKGIKVQDINLTYNQDKDATQSICQNVQGSSHGKVFPPSCL